MHNLIQLDALIKELEDVDVISLYQDNAHALELAHHNDVFFVRLDGNNLYAGPDGDKAASVFYHQVAQIHDDAETGADPSFAALREILQARNDHVRDMLASIGHDHLAASLNGIEFAKEFNFDGFLDVIKHNRSNLEVLGFVNYKPSFKEGEECHTCIFFAAGGYCTKLDLPVKEEMYCDLFKPLPMAEKNEEWAEVSEQPWESEEQKDENEVEGVQKDVRNLIYTSDEDLESPANYKTDSHKPNVIMREFIPVEADEGFAFLVKNADADGVEIQLLQQEGHWYAFSKQRDVSDLGDPFSSVGDVFQPKKVKLDVNDDVEGKEKIARVRGQENEDFEKILPALAAIPAAIGAAVPAVAATVGKVAGTAARVGGQVLGQAAKIGTQAVGQAAKGAARQAGSGGSTESESGGSGSPPPLPSSAEIDSLYNAEDNEVNTNKNDRKPNISGATVPRRIKVQNDQFRNLDYSEIDEGRVEKQSNEGGLGVDDPEALNDGTAASSQHYRRMREDEENSKSSLAMKAYANNERDAQKPIDPDEDGREALSSAETGTGTQAFSSGAIIDISPDETDGVNINTKASGGTGSEGVEGGGDGSATMIAPQDATNIGLESEYDSNLKPINREFRHPHVAKEGGGGDGGGGDGGGVGTSGSFGGGTALSVGGSGGDAVHTDTHGRAARKRNSNGQEGLDKGSLSKDSMDAGSYEGVNTTPLPYPSDDDSRPPRTVERHKPGDSEEDEDEQRASDQEHEIPKHQQPIGEDYASSYVIAEEDRYSPTEVSEKPENEIVRRKFIDEDHHLRSLNDNAAEQYTNLSMLSADLRNHALGKGDTPESLGELDAFKVLTANSIQKMDTGRTLVVAGWGNYYIVDREGHRLGLEGMRRAMNAFLGKKEFANMNIFHSGIQVGQILKRFVDATGKEWVTEVRPEGLFVVAAFRTDLEVSRKAMAEVLKGGLRGFSIAGNAKDKKTICEHGKCWTEVTDLEIYEVTLCVTPMNPKSYITNIIQKPDPMICPECYSVQQLEFDSSLRPK